MAFFVFGTIFTYLANPQPVHAEAGWKIVGGDSVDNPQRCMYSDNNADFENVYSSQAACQAGLTNSENTDFTPFSGESSVPCHPTCSIGGLFTFDTSDKGGKTVSRILFISISIAAIISFIMAGFGAVRIITSAGNPSGINAGREMIIAAISGLLFIIFSVTILQIIGVSSLQIPGFGIY